MVRFIILMQWGRVGSNLIVSIINQSRVALLANERFNTLKGVEAQLAWYEEQFQIGVPNPTHRLIGTKENILAVADVGLLAERLARDGVRVIRMRRDDLVKAAVSQIRAEVYAAKTMQETGQGRWGVRIGEVPLGPIVIDPAILIRRIGIMNEARTRLMATLAVETVLDIEYGDVLHRLDATVDRVRAFLDLDRTRPFRVAFVKATPDHLPSAISNYDEVFAALALQGIFAGRT